MRIDIHMKNCIADRGELIHVPAEFLERNLAPANGEFLKIYLLLLQAAQKRAGMRDGAGEAEEALTEAALTDRLDITVKDVRSALRWWKAQGELDYRRDGDTLVVTLTPERADRADRAAEAAGAGKPAKDASPARDVRPAAGKSAAAKEPSSKRDAEFRQLLFVIETYRKEEFSSAHVEKIAYWYDELGMPADLIESIVESCVENGHTSMRYIEAAVLRSHQEGIRTVEEWRSRNQMFRADFYRILRAFGIRNRGPVEKERKTMEVWIRDYGFSLDIIDEAAERSIHKDHPFEYANSILKGWHEAHVRTVSDIAALDEKHRAAEEQRTGGRTGGAGRPGGAGSGGRAGARAGFSDIPQREGISEEGLMNELRGRNGNLV